MNLTRPRGFVGIKLPEFLSDTLAFEESVYGGFIMQFDLYPSSKEHSSHISSFIPSDALNTMSVP